MGYNIDLIQMFGHFMVVCPHCGYGEDAENHGLEDVDVDCTDYNPEPGVWVIEGLYCEKCEAKFKIRITITTTVSAEEEAD